MIRLSSRFAGHPVSVLGAAALSVALVVPATAQTTASRADRDKIEEAAATVYQWERQFEKTVDAMVTETKKYPFLWSGTQNTASEAQRIARARELVVQSETAVISRAGDAVTAKVDPVELLDHLERVTTNTVTDRDREISEIVHGSYRDAIFDALMVASTKAQKEIEGR